MKTMEIREEFRHLLDCLGFQENPAGIHERIINDYRLAVDCANQRIDYGQAVNRGDETTSNFSQAKNLVVLECVCRLLEKGYRPGDLTLEKRWRLGQTATGGKADIVVCENSENSDKTLFIVECKTWGTEFDREQKKMYDNGGQLFSYLQQDRNTRYLCLYTSRCMDSGDVEYRNAIVKIEDREEDKSARRQGDGSIKLYRTANTVGELFDVWKERFNLYFHYNGIFEDDVNAYEIELKPLKKKDLLPLAEADRVFNRFAEILRHNNISDNANAFNRILSLLLCKMVDEEKADDEVLDFQVKEGEDTPEKIHDRLQNLYQQGMKRYLQESVVYHSDENIREIIAAYPRQTRLNKIETIFREIKYYTNNEFAFKEVHNEELFKQNSRVLNEVIKMLQNYRFKYAKKQQILGDFFELLLNHGVKQSEGQFFTPVPIVRFILLSIGLDRIVRHKLANKEQRFLPKILDYACGSGHFLTESIDELQNHLSEISAQTNGENARQKSLNATISRYKESTDWAKDYIYGVEKDYRLARTAQIACFINGDGEANIIFGDGLENHERLKSAGRFDVVVANPPYSVKAFRNYLRVTQADYTLYGELTEAAKEIEALFVERTAQALAVGGIAGIILPSTILANAGIYTRARGLLLEKFEIKGIAELGSKTFIATGTTTVILFLRRRDDDFAEDRRYIAEDLFAGKVRSKHQDFIDSNKLLEMFVTQKRGIALTDYKTLIQMQPSAAVRKTEWFKDYQNWFDDLAETKTAKSRGISGKDLAADFHRKILAKEKEKFYFFMLCMGNGCESQRVVIVNSGGTTDEQKSFLGYAFSSRKGSEGIKIDKDDTDNYAGKLYDDTDRTSPLKANSYILDNFWGDSPVAIEESLQENIRRVLLTDCLNFNAMDFNMEINPKTPHQREAAWFQTKHPTARLRDIPGLVIRKGTTITKAQTKKGDIPVVAGGRRPAYYHNRANRKGPTITISASGAAGYVNFYSGEIFASDCITVQTEKKCEADIAYVLLCLKDAQKKIFEFARGQAQPHVYPRQIESIGIPLPPPAVQRKIVAECAAVDSHVETSNREIAQLKNEIGDRMREVLSQRYNSRPLGELAQIESGGTPATGTREYWDNGKICWATLADTKQKYLYDTQKKITRAGIADSNAKLLPVNTVLFSSRATIGDVSIAKVETCTNQGYKNFICDEKQLDYEFLYYVLTHSTEDIKTLASGMTYPEISKTTLMSYQIPLPSSKEQKKIAADLGRNDQRIDELGMAMSKASEEKAAVLGKYL